MNFNENLILEFMALGCSNRKDAVVAVQVFLELCEVKKYWNVKYKYQNDLQLFYLTAKKTKSDCISIFVPRSSNGDISYMKMLSYFALCDDNSEVKKVFLVLVSSDSTCVYYQITKGLFEPNNVISKHLTINKQEQIDAEIKKNRALLEEAALCGISVTIKESKS